MVTMVRNATIFGSSYLTSIDRQYGEYVTSQYHLRIILIELPRRSAESPAMDLLLPQPSWLDRASTTFTLATKCTDIIYSLVSSTPSR